MRKIKFYSNVKKMFIFSICTFLLAVNVTQARAEVDSETNLETESAEEFEEEDEPVILEDEEEKVEKKKKKEKKIDWEKKTKENGWSKLKSGKKEYYRYKKDKSKKFATGKTKIGKNYYYFDEKGRLLTEQWIVQNKKKTYYTDKNGVLAKGWKKIGGYHYYFNDNNKLVQDLIKEFGEAWYKKRDIHVKVNKYHNCVTIYAKSNDKQYNIPIRSFPTTAGYATPLLNTKLKKGNTYRWRELMGPTYGQFCTRIHKGFLFHSVLYRRPNKYALNPRQYNKLGRTASHGCIRLAVVDAKRIYDDVRRLGDLRLTIYSDSKSAGPFDKPQYPKVSWNQKYDPTDPTIKK